MKAKLFTLKVKDFLKGLIVAVITALLTLILQALQSGTPMSVKWILTNAAIALVSYLLKNLFTNSDDQFLTKEQ